MVHSMDYSETSMMDDLLSASEKQTLELFHSLVASSGEARDRFAVQLADILGNPGEFSFYILCPEDDRLVRTFHLLRVFSENMELLVHKTWVNADEDKPKVALFEDLKLFTEDYRNGKTVSAFRRFVSIARTIPSLLFGSAGRAPDFLEYAFRIDPKFGLFFWFVNELEKQMRNDDDIGNREELFRIETLLGAYVLSSF